MNTNSAIQETRQKLLDAAGEIFAEQGFHRATTRDICNRAGANAAAINYHFRDKEGLYLEVLKHLVRVAFEKYPPLGGLPPEAPAPQRLRAFIRSWLLRLVGHGMASWHGQLVAREMAEPSSVSNAVIGKAVSDHAQKLRDLVREILGTDATDELVRDATYSIAGQCLFYFHGRQMIRRMSPELKFSDEDIEHLANHIARFTLGGLRAGAKGHAARGLGNF
jgi:AcrR family transcriptional regulator